MSSPVNLLILDIPVSFPYPPYPVQVTYLNKVIEGLTTAKNALLESPTGTGKTMSLLCASLAWQLSVNSKLAAAAKIKIEYNKDATCNLAPPPKSAAGPSFIIYASRTHAQLQQVVQELKKTTYLNTKTVVLGSRDQLCVNDTLKSKNLKGAVLDQACGVLCNQHRCYFKNNLESKKKEQETLPLVADIEDAVAFGKRNSKCSYYGSREAANVADLILMPYNYLLDTTIRSSLRIEWTRAVVIFDEAHNLEEVISPIHDNL
jgi:regulator of telomere elongation helicase 1